MKIIWNKSTKIGTAIFTGLCALLLLIGFQNCGGFAGLNRNYSLLSSTGDGGNIVEGGVGQQKIYQVNYSENLLTSLQNQTGVKTLSANTMNVYSGQISKVPSSQDAGNVTAPMWLAITMISGEVCNDLFTQESALAATQRRILGAVDLSKAPSAISATVRDGMIEAMARLYWARDISADENAMIRQELDSQFALTDSNAADTKKAFLYLCTAMLASLDAQKQ